MKAALFDLDGVVFDTEPQYSVFWGETCRKYRPDIPGLENMIKGQTLVQIFDGYFAGMEAEQAEIQRGLDEFEASMNYIYVPGFVDFISELRSHDVKTALVTSSNIPKMNNVYRSRPEFKELFDVLTTAEDFTMSKPHPDCYIKAMEKLGAEESQSVAFEDSFNGLKSARSSGATVVGLATTNPAESIKPYCDIVVRDFTHLNYSKCVLAEISHNTSR